jgi:hypothetical protein
MSAIRPIVMNFKFMLLNFYVEFFDFLSKHFECVSAAEILHTAGTFMRIISVEISTW